MPLEGFEPSLHWLRKPAPYPLDYRGVESQEGVKVVIVDNTAISLWEVSWYMWEAVDQGHSVTVVEVHCAPAKAAARNVHGVPEHAVRAMADRWEDTPAWWPVGVMQVETT